MTYVFTEYYNADGKPTVYKLDAGRELKFDALTHIADAIAHKVNVPKDKQTKSIAIEYENGGTLGMMKY